LKLIGGDIGSVPGLAGLAGLAEKLQVYPQLSGCSKVAMPF
jgi:hypothetical protein